MYKTNELIIETQNLTFGFNNKQKVLNDINLKIEKGSIYGFLGPNSAGKTTTIRLLLGLLNAPENSITLFGKKFPGYKLEVFSKVGSLIEQPSLYEHLSGYDNLEITRLIRKVNRKKVAEVLDLVKLSNVAAKKVGDYSMGMKQRLGLAIALIGEPELLILDEPVNGLDPNGIIEIRELLRSLNRELETTIFLSSHLLSEIEKLVTHIGIINMGELLFQGTITDLREIQTGEAEVHIETGNNKAALELLQNKYPIHAIGETLVIRCQSKEEVPNIVNYLVFNDIKIYKTVVQEKDLEHLFMQMTENYIVS